MESKGYIDDESIDIAEKQYGKNEMIMVQYTFFKSFYLMCLVLGIYHKVKPIFVIKHHYMKVNLQTFK